MAAKSKKTVKSAVSVKTVKTAAVPVKPAKVEKKAKSAEVAKSVKNTKTGKSEPAEPVVKTSAPAKAAKAAKSVRPAAKTSAKKYVYLFGKDMSEGRADMKELLGGKGANLAEMANLGLPVPAGFTITTECCVDYFRNGSKAPASLEAEVLTALKKVEKCMGMKFGDKENPLLVSCRSGARSSMPGMMETVLNVGLSSATIPGLIKKTKNERFVYDAYRRLIMMYSDVVMEKAEGIEPEDGKGIRKLLDEQLEQLKKRIEGLSNPGLVSENEKLLEQLKRALEQADGLTEVFARQMTKPDGKYIVFCSGREHMDEMKSQAADWFSKVDKKPHIYTAYYNDASTSKAFAEFKKDTGSHLKLLYCIDMLNEGIHVDDVDGVILLRPTVSPIIYLQQIGRALSAGSKNQPVIFDLVNNFDSLYCIDCLKNEMQEAFLLYPDTHSQREHFDDRFRIIDETKDSRDIFMRLQENLGSAWDTYYEAAKQWYEENGNLKIPKSYVTGSGLTLGAWINTQRRVKSGNISGNLTWEKIQKLNDIGMIWDVTDSSWQEVLEELKSYRNTYGNLDIKAKYVSPTGFRLGSWINNMRFKVKKYGIEQALTDEQRKALEELGMIWDHNKQKWEEYFSAAKAYYKEHGNLEVPAKYVTADGIPLGRWLSNQTNSHSMTDEQLQRLQSIGYMSESKAAIQWNRKFELAKTYYEKNGNLDVPVSYSTDGVKLGRWISNIRCKRKQY